jgi:hypothetical protein
MDWRCGSSSRVPALQVQSPEFKPQFNLKKKKGERKETFSKVIHLRQIFLDFQATLGTEESWA